MDKPELNIHEQAFAENIDIVFEIMVHEWLEDLRDGNRKLIPGSTTEAKKEILRIGKEWLAILPYSKKTEYEMHRSEIKIPWILIRNDIIERYIDELFINIDEAIELGLMAGWINWSDVK